MKIAIGAIRRDLESRLNALGVKNYRPVAVQITDEVIKPILVAVQAHYDQIMAHQADLREEIVGLHWELEIACMPDDPDAEEIAWDSEED